LEKPLRFPVDWQWKSGARGYNLLILLALARFGRRNSTSIHYTGTAVDVAKLTGLNSRTAQRAIKDLINLKIIIKASDNMSLGVSVFILEPATICRLGNQGSDNMSLGIAPPNDIYIDNSIDNIIYSNPHNTIDVWAKDFNEFKYNEEGLTKEKIKTINTNFKDINLTIEVQKFIDYWSSKEKPPSWSGYRRLLTWLQKAGKDNNEGFKSRRFSKSKSIGVNKEIDSKTKQFAERQRVFREQEQRKKNNS